MFLTQQAEIFGKQLQPLRGGLATSRDLLDFGIAEFERRMNGLSLPRLAMMTVGGMFVKLSTSFRSVIILNSHGHEREAMPITRSMFENLLHLRFILDSDLEIDGEKLGAEFKAQLYRAWAHLRTIKEAKSLGEIDELKEYADRIHAHATAGAFDPKADLGDKWFERLTRSKSLPSCIGLPVIELTKAINPTYVQWYRSVYSSDSKHIHQRDMTEYIDLIEEGDGMTIELKWFTSAEGVLDRMRIAATIYVEFLASFGLHAQADDKYWQRVNQFADAIQSWE
ncbi:DUF5677 domain-containing protein [Lacunimicrobium album]